MMQCAVHPKEFSRVSTCNSVKEMWDKLELIYEGTSEVRETKTSMLVVGVSFRLRCRGRCVWPSSAVVHGRAAPSLAMKDIPVDLVDSPFD
ncbi:hypothetical protein Taro_019522 [Colocasia esculenta]|uniref:Uncharacterized protein n=1 Tax=Colocasia esculenta TaxID=4460 RepID=A0A843UU07_COLES|nr:hypothetical protein [Colocasia esculenta]